MTYAIHEARGALPPIKVARVEDLETAQLWIAEKHRDADPEIIFEIDEPNNAADAAVITSSEIILYNVEPEKETSQCPSILK